MINNTPVCELALGSRQANGQEEGKYYEHLKEQKSELEASILDLKKDKEGYFNNASQKMGMASTASIRHKLTATVPHGFSYWNYSVQLATDLQGYSMKCEYQKTLAPEGQLTSNSDLVELYFKTEEKAGHATRNLTRMRKNLFDLQDYPISTTNKN